MCPNISGVGCCLLDELRHSVVANFIDIEMSFCELLTGHIIFVMQLYTM